MTKPPSKYELYYQQLNYFKINLHFSYCKICTDYLSENCYHPFSCQQNKIKFLMLVHKENCFTDLIFRCPKINFLFRCIYLDNFYLKYEPCDKNNNNNNNFLFRFLKKNLTLEKGFPNFLRCNL